MSLHHVFSSPFEPSDDFLGRLEELYDQHFNLHIISFGEFSESVRDLLAQGFISDFPNSNDARQSFLATLDFVQDSNFYLKDKLAGLIYAIQVELFTNTCKLL